MDDDYDKKDLKKKNNDTKRLKSKSTGMESIDFSVMPTT